MAFDCHWILINEVSPADMIHASRCVFVCLYFDLDKDTGPELFVLISKENAHSFLFFFAHPLVSFYP